MRLEECLYSVAHSLARMAEASYHLTSHELRSFLLTGVLRVITGENWTNKAFVLATVKNEMGEVILRKKYIYNGGQHAEEQLIADLRRKGKNLIDGAKEIELLSNYSPCDRCASQLIRLKSGVKITIKCAHLYDVWPQPNVEFAKANLQGLRAEDAYRFKHFQMLTG